MGGWMIDRPENWPQLLIGHIDAYRSRSFVWGKSDCTRFIAEWLDLVRGTEYASDIPTNYNTERGAFKVLKRHYKVSNLPELVSRELGSQYDNFMYAQRGDIVASDTHPDYSDAFGCALGINLGENVAFFGPSNEGLVFYPFNCEVITTAWRV